MSTPKKNLNQSLIAQFSGQKNYITTPKIYCKLTQCLNKAYVLNQIIFYSSHSSYCSDDWFYKSYAEWLEEVFVKERTLRTYFKEFVDEGWIEMRIAKIKGVRTPFFRPMMENITNAIAKLIDEEPKTPPITPLKPKEKPMSKSCPKRQKLPDSQTAKIAVSNTIYTDNSSDKKTTTKDKTQSSSSFLTTTQNTELLKHKLKTDTRTDDLFLKHCHWHIEKQENDHTKYQRVKGLLKILKGLMETGEHFKAKGYIDPIEKKKADDDKAKKELWRKYQEYRTQFFNDRDVLNIASVQGKEPKEFDQWEP